MARRPLLSLFGALAIVVAACAGTPAATPTAAPTTAPTAAPTPTEAGVPDRLVLGLVPSREADVLVENAQPLADYLSEQLGIPVDSFVPQDYPGLVAAMRTGQAHIGAFGPFGLIQSVDEAGAEIILQSARDGAVTYHTQWMTNDPDTYCADDVVTDDAGLTYCNGTLEATEGPFGEDAIALIPEGTTVSFVGETSASGYLFPALQLLQLAGLDRETDIDPLFAGGHPASVIAVCNADAPVGVAFDDARTILAEGDCDDLGNVVVFAFSQEIPNDGVSVVGTLPDELKQQIAASLMAYSETEDGAAVLDSIYEIDEFGPADLDAFDVVRQVAEELGVTSD
jgi:phosphonate transport system substrate-binding protein